MRFRHYVRLIFLIFAVVAVTAPVAAAQDSQDRKGKNIFREWIKSQSTALQQLRAFSVSETVHSSLNAGGGQRNYRLVARRAATRTPDGEKTDDKVQPGRFRMEREILQLVANGQEISADRTSRFLMQQRRMMRPELSRVLDSFRFPVQEVGRWESDEPLQLIERGGTHYWKLNGIATIRLPFGPPERRNGREAESRPASPTSRKSHVTAWFTTDTFRLHTTLVEYRLPGRFSLSLRTSYSSEGPLDIPKKRVIEGTVPMRRRSRIFAVHFKQTTDYTDYEFRRN